MSATEEQKRQLIADLREASRPAAPVRDRVGLDNLDDLVGRCCECAGSSTGPRVRALLRSLWDSEPCDLALVSYLDKPFRQMLCQLLLDLCHSVYDYHIRMMFTRHDHLAWFLEHVNVDELDVAWMKSEDERKLKECGYG